MSALVSFFTGQLFENLFRRLG